MVSCLINQSIISPCDRISIKIRSFSQPVWPKEREILKQSLKDRRNDKLTRHEPFRLLVHRIRHKHLPRAHRFRLRQVHRLLSPLRSVDRLTRGPPAAAPLAALAYPAQSLAQVGR